MKPAKKKDTGKLYHDTEYLLKKYRDIRYDMICQKMYAEKEVEAEFGMNIDDFLDATYQAGLNFEDTKLESMIKNLKLTNDMLKMLCNTVTFIRENHKYGEIYYWILFYTYLSQYKADDFEILLEKIGQHVPYISSYIYYDRRKEAINKVSDYLWGYTSKETIEVLTEIIKEMESMESD